MDTETVLGQEIGLNEWHFCDLDGARHDLAMGDGLYIDGQPCGVALKENHVNFESSSGVISCSYNELWKAFARSLTRILPQKVGRLVAEHLRLWDRERQWRVIFEALQHQSTIPLDPVLLQPFLPPSRLDTSVQKVIGDCEQQSLTLAQVQAMAVLLHKDMETVAAWLQERGIVILRPLSVLAVSAEPENKETPAQDELVRQDQSSLAPEETHEWGDEDAKRPVFRWTRARLRLLRQEFFSLSERMRRNISAAAGSIARRHMGWTEESVTYKISQLRLYEQLPSCDEAFTLLEGPFLWDIKVEGTSQRWGLNYRYGDVPLLPKAYCRYRDQLYHVQWIWTSQLVLSRISASQYSCQADAALLLSQE